MPALVYIHGFLSSPQSYKARQLQQWLAERRPDIDYCAPSLSAYPDEARAQLDALLSRLQGQSIGLVGSSLGGYWATYLAEAQDLRAVLINPSVRPYDMMQGYLGKTLQNYYSEDSYQLQQQHVEQIRRVDTPSPARPQNYWLMVQTGDEVLDYRLAVDKYRAAEQLVEEGGDHGFQGFERWIPQLVDFLRL